MYDAKTREKRLEHSQYLDVVGQRLPQLLPKFISCCFTIFCNKHFNTTLDGTQHIWNTLQLIQMMIMMMVYLQ